MIYIILCAGILRARFTGNSDFTGERKMSTRMKIIAAALGAAGAIATGQAGAAGFQLLEQNASGLGNAYSGTAASAEDATTIFFNPAGMSFLPGSSAAISLDLVKPSAKFTPTFTPTIPSQA
ncbi:MAG TPA: outer membrane protein transport protein, partial [Burkholderiales bacterium]